MLALGLMLDHADRREDGDRLREAIDRTLAAGTRTGDLGGDATTLQFGKAVAANL